MKTTTKECVISKILPKEHAKAEVKNPTLTNNMIVCPLFNDRQICMWCCVHIYDQADPSKVFSSDFNPHYYDLISEVLKMSIEEVWRHCSGCGNQRLDTPGRITV